MANRYFYSFVITEDLLFGAIQKSEELGLKFLQVLPGMQPTGSPLMSPNGKPQMALVYKVLCRCPEEAWKEMEKKLKAVMAEGPKALQVESPPSA